MGAVVPLISAVLGTTAGKIGAGAVGGALISRLAAPKPPAMPAMPAAVAPTPATATPTPPAAPTTPAGTPASAEEIAASPAVAAAEETAKKGRAATIATAPGGILGTAGTRERRSIMGGGLIR